MRKVNVNQMIDESKFNRFHALVIFLCAYIIFFDGYDLVMFGSVLPILMEEWSLTPAQAGALGSYVFFGTMLGGVIFGSFADKMGRKNIILFCLALFSLFTGLIGLASGPVEFGIYRFLAGLGLGGVMPNVVALVTEYSPKSLKSTLVSVMFSGFSVGGVASAGLAIVLISKFGWQSVFFVGAIPLLSIPLLYKYLPDSIEFILAKNQDGKVSEVLSKINPSFTPIENDYYEMTLPEKTGSPVMGLFRNGRALTTVMFFITFFMVLLMIYGLNTWLPKLMADAGYELGSSIMFLLILNLGSVFGAILGGVAADRWNGKKVLILFFVLAAVSLILLGFRTNTIVLYLLIAVAGATTIGTQIIVYAYASQIYPIHMRSTGLGWISGVGRLGAVLGPLLGGFLLTINLTVQQNFLAFAIPGIIAAFAIALVKDLNTLEHKPHLGTSTINKHP